MKVAVMGAGAVGSYYGAMLARAGCEVVLIGRAEHVDAVRDAGLLLETREFAERLALSASTQADAVAGAGIVLFCVKANDSLPAAADIAPCLAPEAVVVSLQNGVDNAERLRPLLAREVIAAVVYVAAEMAGPGHVRHHGRGELVIGRTPATAKLADLFAAAEVPLTVSDDIAGVLWGKLVVNCVYNALSAITRLPYARLVEAPGVEALMRDVIDECLTVAHADGVRVAGDIYATVSHIARTMPTQFSSTAQDIVRGKRSEIDHLNGYVVRRGMALGVATPVNHTLLTLIHALEQRPAT